MAKWNILVIAHHQPVSDMAWLTLTLGDSVCTNTVELMNFRMYLSFLPAHFRLSVNLLSHNVIFSLLTGYGAFACNVIIKYLPHMWTCCTQELRGDVPDNNGISKWKRLTNSLNVITPGVDLILWALVLLSHWSVRLSHLSVWCQICLKLSQLSRQNESHYNWCISLWKEKPDPFTKQRDILLLSSIAYF